MTRASPRHARPETALERLRICIDDGYAVELVRAYYDPRRGFAATSFDTLGDNQPNEFRAPDLLALNLLDERLNPTAIRWLLSDEGRDVMRPLLEGIDVRAILGGADDGEHLDAVSVAYERLTELSGVGPTKATKLLARKRPALVPILDKVVRTVVGAPRDRHWSTFQTFMVEKGNCGRLEEIKRGAGVPDEITLLRVLDVAIWMSGSGSRSAWRVRDGLGVPDLAWAPRPRSRPAS